MANPQTMNPDWFKSLMLIYSKIKGLAAPDFMEDLYIDASITVKSMDGFTIGRFYTEDDFWLFELNVSDD